MMLNVDSAVSSFGSSARGKLSNPGAYGQSEDQLRAPFEELLGDMTELSHL